MIRRGVSALMPKHPIRTLGAKVKEIMVRYASLYLTLHSIALHIFIISELNIVRVRLCMPNTRSKGAPLLPYDPEFQRTLRKMVNAQELEAQRHRLGLEAEIDTAKNVHQTTGINQPRLGFQQNIGINQPRVVEENKWEEGVVYPQHQPIAPRGRAQHPAHMMYEEDDADLDGAGAIGAIVLPALPQMLTGDDANQYLMNFMAICKSQEIPGVNQIAMRLRLFPLSLTGEATNWLNEMPDDSIRTWKVSLNYITKPVVDSVCRGSFIRKSFAENMQLLDEVSKNNRAWYTRDTEGNWQNRDGHMNDHSGVYVPPGNRDLTGGSSSGSKLEDMMAKVLQKVESTDAGVKEMKDDSEEVEHKSQPTRGKEKGVEENLPLQQIPRPPPPFPQRFRKKAEDGKFTKFITTLKQLLVNIPLVEALE
ncbi:hypothetical protein R3W88_031806 [Solanum pinnatisectum]|uniref:Retrotransposon gag domain-containing protein n=1 Tax=Solanum pinnatisectum TaxID=50273 RepID=A0AAV9LQV3_9SOLN|nr:hypothetical protein R3W88_031806 [Solanum pinnatisectum]